MCVLSVLRERRPFRHPVKAATDFAADGPAFYPLHGPLRLDLKSLAVGGCGAERSRNRTPARTGRELHAWKGRYWQARFWECRWDIRWPHLFDLRPGRHASSLRISQPGSASDFSSLVCIHWLLRAVVRSFAICRPDRLRRVSQPPAEYGTQRRESFWPGYRLPRPRWRPLWWQISLSGFWEKRRRSCPCFLLD